MQRRAGTFKRDVLGRFSQMGQDAGNTGRFGIGAVCAGICGADDPEPETGGRIFKEYGVISNLYRFVHRRFQRNSAGGNAVDLRLLYSRAAVSLLHIRSFASAGRKVGKEGKQQSETFQERRLCRGISFVSGADVSGGVLLPAAVSEAVFLAQPAPLQFSGRGNL